MGRRFPRYKFQNQISEEPPAWRRYDAERVTQRMPLVTGQQSSMVLYDVSRPQFRLLRDLDRQRFISHTDIANNYGLTTNDIYELISKGLLINGPFEVTMSDGQKLKFDNSYAAITDEGHRLVGAVGVRVGRERSAR